MQPENVGPNDAPIFLNVVVFKRSCIFLTPEMKYTEGNIFKNG